MVCNTLIIICQGNVIFLPILIYESLPIFLQDYSQFLKERIIFFEQQQACHRKAIEIIDRNVGWMRCLEVH